MKYTLRALSALIAYPSEDLQAHIGPVREALYREAELPPEALARLDPLFDAFASQDLFELQVHYCELFDSSRALSLHLFEHVHGDGRQRGQAMIDLGQTYLARGFMMREAELPDYLPMFLEFLSILPQDEAEEWLAQPTHVLATLEQRLIERETYYAAVLHNLLHLAKRRPSSGAVQDLPDYRDPATPDEIDRAWEDAPIDFRAPLGEATQPSTLMTRLRAAQRDARDHAKGG
ncbi:nitrate reductase molybdenum cofactor assembly chaperone [Methylorubrum podarium]|jgi:nitrate reductase molybdenum cofactor assembly chaperone NarJ/NarW|uniref:nitrate reductase molybdenum cofactor assembly chaperone n=1 Tax=Methylorubrum podarium TaxID=200476 RepID=UPI001EE27AD7|nr:nitrate reductase molybdenum cofactor assembly chaperone [Methylorubrum podarium]GJE69459.1 Nitrate reductase molybdenum cofactor assembly chaperone NarJ [Methylorubrum podarium]